MSGNKREYVQLEDIVEANEDKAAKVENGKKQNKKSGKKTLLRRLPSLRSTLSFKMGRLRSSFRSINCFKTEDEDEVPFKANALKARRSIDIGVGLARRMSLFIFTKRTVCAHPYHPYYPEQTTRKIYVFHDEH